MIQIGVHEGSGWKPVIKSRGDWMVAISNWEKSASREGFSELARHPNSDEVFVLLKEKVRLLLAGKGRRPGRAKILTLRKGRAYNVEKGTWHKIIMSARARVLIVENKNTRAEKYLLPEEELKALKTRL